VFGRLRQRLPTRHQPISNPRFSRALMFEVEVITVQVWAEGAGTGTRPGARTAATPAD
jgi:hypothetical protein